VAPGSGQPRLRSQGLADEHVFAVGGAVPRALIYGRASGSSWCARPDTFGGQALWDLRKPAHKLNPHLDGWGDAPPAHTDYERS